MTIADRIKEKRLELGWSQEDLAKKMGYKDKTSVSKMESSGDNITSMSDYYANKMNVHIDKIIKEDA